MTTFTAITTGIALVLFLALAVWLIAVASYLGGGE